MKFIYMLKSEDFTQLGSPMGSERTTTNFILPYSSLEFAKQYAQKDYEKQGGGDKIKWFKGRSGQYLSQDLLFVGYNIMKVKLNQGIKNGN